MLDTAVLINNTVLYCEQIIVNWLVYKTLVQGVGMKTQAISTLPRAARQALVKLGGDITVARKKRRISTVSMAERAFISRGTLYKAAKVGKMHQRRGCRTWLFDR